MECSVRSIECPLCGEVLVNPTELRNHRLLKHRSPMVEINYTF